MAEKYFIFAASAAAAVAAAPAAPINLNTQIKRNQSIATNRKRIKTKPNK